jgi:hypothetical protein
LRHWRPRSAIPSAVTCQGAGVYASGAATDKCGSGRSGVTGKVAGVWSAGPAFCNVPLNRRQTQSHSARISFADFPEDAYSVMPQPMPSASCWSVRSTIAGNARTFAIFRATARSPSDPAAIFRRALRCALLTSPRGPHIVPASQRQCIVAPIRSHVAFDLDQCKKRSPRDEGRLFAHVIASHQSRNRKNERSAFNHCSAPCSSNIGMVRRTRPGPMVLASVEW